MWQIEGCSKCAAHLYNVVRLNIMKIEGTKKIVPLTYQGLFLNFVFVITIIILQLYGKTEL